MTRATPQIAIILRGPPGVGKSTITKRITDRFGPSECRVVNLDADWGVGEWRYSQQLRRYEDLSAATERILLVELAGGEPPDWSFPGATRGANEWVQVLRQAGRIIYPFFLTADLDDAIARLFQRNGPNHHLTIYQLGFHVLHSRQHPLVTIPTMPGLTEVEIVTTNQTEQSVAGDIMRRAGLIP